ncbi:MAG: HAD family hydrolase [Bacteroidaceae bacterium]|nr:HAD family hydrolase [Bacteroidaceae bacterium]
MSYLSGKRENMQLIILDFDGTIGDTKSLIVSTFQKTIKELGMPPRTDEECASTIGLPLKEAFMSLFTIESARAELCTDTYRRIFYRSNTPGAVKPFPHTIETLHKLHASGYTLTIASSRNRHTLDEYLREMQIKDIVSLVVGADDTQKAKPHPEPAEKILQHFSCPPHEAIVVGDTHYDILMGLRAGCHTCGVTYGNGSRNELLAAGAQHIIEDFSQLRDIL